MEQYRLFDDFSDKVKRAIQLFQMFEDAAVRYHEDGYTLPSAAEKTVLCFMGLQRWPM